MVLLYPVFFIFLAYLAVILWFTTGWLRNKRLQGSVVPNTKIGIIVPFRNEESVIVNCLEDIVSQDYPIHLLEVWLADDYSDDRSSSLVLDFINHHPAVSMHYLKVEGDPGKANKKAAIEQVVGLSTGELIIMSDADTRFSKDRLRVIVDYYEQTRAKMILGPVELSGDATLFGRMQSLEFLGLMGVTAGSCGTGFPVMCNGANLAFERAVFAEVGGFSDNRGYSSGDDLFLLLKIRNKYGNRSIVYAKSREAVVHTSPQKTVRGFLSQRLRWVSKSRGYHDGMILFTAIIAYLANLSVAALLIGGIFSIPLLWIGLSLLAIKMIVEFPLMLMTCRFYGKESLLVYYPVVQFLNLYYVTFVGLLGNFLSFDWKGRKLQH